MTIVGIDLAGLQKNDTGFCIFDSNGERTVRTGIVHSDQSIIECITSCSADLVAIDAPSIYDGQRRSCDAELAEYGVLPVTLSGMSVLAQRGSSISLSLTELNIPHIEVSSKTSAKLLGVYSKDDFSMQKNMMSLGLAGDINRKIMTRDEMDAVVAAMTGYLHLQKSTKEVGDERGIIIIPDV